MNEGMNEHIPTDICNMRVSGDMKSEGLRPSPASTSPRRGAPRANHFTPLSLSVLLCEMGVLIMMLISLPSHGVVVGPFETDRMTLLLSLQPTLFWHHLGCDGHGRVIYVVHKEHNISLPLPFNIAVNMSYGGDNQDTARVMVVMESDR